MSLHRLALLAPMLMLPHAAQGQFNNLRIQVPVPAMPPAKMTMPVVPGTAVAPNIGAALSAPALAPNTGPQLRTLVPTHTPDVGATPTPAGSNGPNAGIDPRALTVDSNSIGLFNDSTISLVIELTTNGVTQMPKLDPHKLMAFPANPPTTIKGRVTTLGGHVEEITFASGRVYVLRWESDHWAFAQP